jgi:endonuclease/exonuclease/phosphatase family metal-dependent hydrolase
MQYLYFPARPYLKSGRDFGNAILSRWPIRDARKLVLPHLARIVHSQRIATACTVDIGGQPVRLYSVHAALPFTVSGKGRREQMQAIIDDARDAPGGVIIAGDLHSHGLGECFADAGFAWPSRRIGSTERWFDVDQIFSRGFRLAGPDLIGVVRNNRKASDHRPVWAVMKQGTAPPTSAGR